MWKKRIGSVFKSVTLKHCPMVHKLSKIIFFNAKETSGAKVNFRNWGMLNIEGGTI